VSADLPEGWEAWLAYFSASLPDPVTQTVAPDGTVAFHAGDPGEVIVHLAPDLITVSSFSVRWSRAAAGPRRGGAGHGLALQPLIVAKPAGYVRWRRLPPNNAQAVVDALVAAARAARLATFRVCDQCERTWPPELMYDDETCDGCAARAGSRVH
jgi:hypothetical protein